MSNYSRVSKMATRQVVPDPIDVRLARVEEQLRQMQQRVKEINAFLDGFMKGRGAVKIEERQTANSRIPQLRPRR